MSKQIIIEGKNGTYNIEKSRQATNESNLVEDLQKWQQILYLKDETLVLNHKYLWDIVCKPNDKLFKEGINIVILDETNYDLTNNIDILCPPNSYSKYSTFASDHFRYCIPWWYWRCIICEH